ncbi:MAG: alpha-amylase/4-alpha-glucanotransferase domain-containing protein [Candidatus Hodarchaeales archaeon]
MSTEKDGSIFFPIVFHMHQPLGNFPWVFQDAYEKSYQPLLETIFKYPEIKVNLHITGPLLLWLKENQPEYINLICELYKKKQIEIVGGGFYEPILAILPEADRLKQIQMTIHWWESNYGITPHGLWLAERVWTPDLPRTLAKAGIEFVFIDDYLFRMAGFSESETFYAYKTESQGKAVTVFPINESIRYLVPWRDSKETIQYLETARDENNERIVVMISDAEKMGIWPAGDRTTHDICYINGYDGKQGWMHSFFEAIISNKWIKPIIISDYLKEYHPRGLIYLPTSSYDKMAIWALPTPLRKRLEQLHQKAKNDELPFSSDIKTFATGSFWQNFLVKYPQSNIMHKRMLYCRNKMEKVREIIPKKSENLLEPIWDLILASQSNDPHWHGLFGGVYYRFLRQTAHKNILQAEVLLDSLYEKFDIPFNACEVKDVLLDGNPDGILENKYISCFISSLKGGSIFSLNSKDKTYNFSNVLRRQLEAYHTDEVPAINDRFEKWSFQDHFIQSIDNLELFQNDQYVDLGNFANQPYKIIKNSSESISFIRNGRLIANEKRVPIKITKSYSLSSTILKIDYSIEFSEGIGDIELFFSPEMNFIGASYPYKTNGYINSQKFDLKDVQYETDCRSIEIRDENEIEMASLIIHFPFLVKCIVFPLMSFPKSELGFEKQYQGTSIFPFIQITEKNTSFHVEINLVPL